MSKEKCSNCPFCGQEKEQSMTLEEIDSLIEKIKNKISFYKKTKHGLTPPLRKSIKMDILWLKQDLKELENKRKKLIKEKEGEDIEQT